MPDSQSLRAQIRQRRGTLSSHKVSQVSTQVCKKISDAGLIRDKEHIAFYYPHGGEIDPEPLVSQALEMNKQCYLPVLHPDGSNRLKFAPFQSTLRLTPNRYGILEPAHPQGQLVSGDQLDLVLVPLVVCDRQGNRIGMGKGYYDRTFAFLREQTRPTKPLLIGLTYSFQQVAQLTPQNWDIPLDGTASENGLALFSHTPGA